MINSLFKIFKKEYQTLNRIEISKNNLEYNYQYLSSLSGSLKIAPVIKSDAYGHGINKVAKILNPLGAPFFCVDSLYEAYELLKDGIKTPILIMGYTAPQNFKVKKLPFSYAVFDLETIKVLNEYQEDCKVHIFIDTGMNREGIQIEKIPEFLDQLKNFPNVKVEGLMSHLASSDNPKDSLNKVQIKNFYKALEIFKKYNIHPKWIHFFNSDGLLNHVPTSKVGRQNMARVGLALYGISHNTNLKPVLRFTTQIAQIKKVKSGDRVGYDGTYTIKKPTTIGILPAGYYDGVDHRLSNKGSVLVNGIACPIIGRVSMNITTVDLSNVSNPFIGQEVVVYSDNPNDPNSIKNAAKICKTIPYDILIGLTASIKRIII